jgi:hypothetical protein
MPINNPESHLNRSSRTTAHGKGSLQQGSENYGQTKTRMGESGAVAEEIRYENRTTEEKVRETIYKSGRVVQRYSDRVVVIEADGSKTEFKRKLNPSEKIVQERLDTVTESFKQISKPENYEGIDFPLTEERAGAFMDADPSSLTDEEIFKQIQIGEEIKLQLESLSKQRLNLRIEIQNLKNSNEYYVANTKIKQLESEISQIKNSLFGRARGALRINDEAISSRESQILKLRYNGIMDTVRFKEGRLANLEDIFNKFSNPEFPTDSINQKQKELLSAYLRRAQEQMITETLESRDYSEVLGTLNRRIEKSLTEEEEERGESRFPFGEVDLTEEEIKDALKQITVYATEYQFKSGKKDTATNALYENINPSLRGLLDDGSRPQIEINKENFRQVSILLSHLLTNKQAAYMFGGHEVLQQVYNQIRDVSVNKMIQARLDGEDYTEAKTILSKFKDPVSVSNYIFELLSKGDTASLIDYITKLKPEERSLLKDMSGIKELSELLIKIKKNPDSSLETHKAEYDRVISLMVPSIVGTNSRIELNPQIISYFNERLHPELKDFWITRYNRYNPQAEYSPQNLSNIRENINSFTRNIIFSSIENPENLKNYIESIVNDFIKNRIPNVKLIEQYLCLIDNLTDEDIKNHPELLKAYKKLVEISKTALENNFNYYLADPRFWRAINLNLARSRSREAVINSPGINDNDVSLTESSFINLMLQRYPSEDTDNYYGSQRMSLINFFQRVSNADGQFLIPQSDSIIYHLFPVGTYFDTRNTKKTDMLISSVTNFMNSNESAYLRGTAFLPFARDFIEKYLPKGEVSVEQIYKGLVLGAEFIKRILNEKVISNERKILNKEKYDSILKEVSKM